MKKNQRSRTKDYSIVIGLIIVFTEIIQIFFGMLDVNLEQYNARVLEEKEHAIKASILSTPPKVKHTYLIQLRDNGRFQMAGYIIKTENDKVIVIDGGTTADTQNLIDNIEKLTGKVDYWFLTHPHRDHVECFMDIVKNTDIEIGHVYVTLNDREWYQQYDSSKTEAEYELMDVLQNEKLNGKIEEVTLNQVMQIDNINCEILGIKNPELTMDALNNSSMVIKMDTGTQTVLFLGDAGQEAGEKLLRTQADKLKADIVQMAHHGQSGVDRAVYELIRPTVCLWPTPKWLWENDSGAGEDSGPWKTKETRKWMKDLEVMQNIIEMNGNIEIEI